MRKVSPHRQLLLDLTEYTLPPSTTSRIAPSNGHDGDRQLSPVSHPEHTPCERTADSSGPGRPGASSPAQQHPGSSRAALDASAPVAESVARLCRRIVERLSKPCGSSVGPGGPLEELQRKLRGLAIPLPFSDDSPIAGARWPVNRLSDDDMRRLRVLSNLTGKPVNGILHHAVQTLFEQTKWLVSQLVACHEDSGTPLAELLDQALSHNPAFWGESQHDSAPQLPSRVHASATGHGPQVATAPDHLGTLDSPPAETSLAAESSPPKTVGRLRDTVPFKTR